jgi:hypothetical protein
MRGAARRLSTRIRRGVARLRTARELEIHVLPRTGPTTRRASRFPSAIGRLDWSPERGLSGTLRPVSGSLIIVAPDLAGVVSFGRDPAAIARTRHLTIRIGDWSVPFRGWLGRPGSLRGITDLQVRIPRSGEGHVEVGIALAVERPIREVIAAVEPMLAPRAPLLAPVPGWLGANGRVPVWLSLDADEGAHFAVSPLVALPEGVNPISGLPRRPDDPPLYRSPVDVELVMGDAEPVGYQGNPVRAVRATDEGLEVDPSGRVLVDTLGWAGNRWRAPVEAAGHARIEVRQDPEGVRWRVAAVEAGTVAGPWLPADVAPSDVTRSGAPSFWSLAPDIGRGVPSATAAALLVRIALSGVVIDGRQLAREVATHLSEELSGVIAESLPPLSDAFAWEVRSVRQRRAAVRGHATSLMLAGRLPREGSTEPTFEPTPPTVTAVLVTRRPRLAASALRMVRDQTYPRLDVILAVHGVPVAPELEAEVAEPGVPVELMRIPADANLGEAIELATARARGAFVTKVDDDDVYGPEHVWDLVIARAISGAMVVGKTARFVMLDRMGITVSRDDVEHDHYGRVVAGGTIMIARGDLAALGGWRPNPQGIDRSLLDRVIHSGNLIYRTWAVGFIYRRHGRGHTWDSTDEYFLRGAGARWEGIPDSPEFGSRRVPTMDEVDESS